MRNIQTCTAGEEASDFVDVNLTTDLLSILLIPIVSELDDDKANALYSGALRIGKTLVSRSISEQRDILNDKIDGMDSDLFAAVEVAYKNGATEWVSRNYPSWFERFENEKLISDMV